MQNNLTEPKYVIYYPSLLRSANNGCNAHHIIQHDTTQMNEANKHNSVVGVFASTMAPKSLEKQGCQ
jgi:hypothetical protein